MKATKLALTEAIRRPMIASFESNPCSPKSSHGTVATATVTTVKTNRAIPIRRYSFFAFWIASGVSAIGYESDYMR